MKNGPTKQDVLWMVAGAAIFVAVFGVIWVFRQDPAQAIAGRSNRAEVVGRMQAALYSASEAEKSAVLAVTDADSQSFAGQARSATAEVEQGRQELERLLGAGGTPAERALLAQFSEAFASLRRVDDEVLRLAGMSTRVSANGLGSCPAGDPEDSNVQSLALSLNQQRKARVPCLEALAALKQAILEERIPGVSYGPLPTR